MIIHRSYHQKNWIILLLLSVLYLSCEIEDDHGTIEYVLTGDDLMVIKGESLGNYYTYEDFVVNEQSQVIYFVNCGGQSGMCEQHIIRSLNYETGESKVIYQSPDPNIMIILFDFIPGTNTLYFHATYYPAENFIAINVNTLTSKVLSTGMWNTAVNGEYVFNNYEYDSHLIKKINLNGSEEILNTTGNIMKASQNTPEILVQDPNGLEYFIYNYQTDVKTFTQQIEYYISTFYTWYDDLFYLTEYPGYSIKNFKTDETIFTLPSSSLFIANFNPLCLKVGYIEEKPVSKFSEYYQIQNQQLIVKDLTSDETHLAVSLYNDWINRVKILDDGNTIIYTSGDRFYKTTIE